MKRLFYKLLLITHFFIYHFIFPAILEGELIVTPHGLIPVEHINIGDYVITHNSQGYLTTTVVTYIRTDLTDKIYQITLDKETIYSAANQKFYDPLYKKWIAAKNITVNNTFIDSQHIHHTCLHCSLIKTSPTKIYYISTEKPHKFFISSSQILTHNALPFIGIGLAWAFGSGLEFVGTSLIFAGASLASISLHKKHKKPSVKIKITPHITQNSSPNITPEDPDKKKKKRDEKRKNHTPLNNNKAEEQAHKLGYRKVKDHPCKNTRNQHVFTNGRDYISPDINGHRGEYWKVFNLRGILRYSADIDLKTICKIYK